MDRTLYPLTNAQKSIWVADYLYPETSQNNLAATLIIGEPVDFALMNEAYNLVLKNNDALRIRLINQDGTPKQYFAPYVFQDFDMLDFGYPGGKTEFKNWEDKMTQKPFPLIDSELIYFAMVKLAGEKSICFLNFHHIIVDAWGVVLITRKIMKEYWQLKHGIQASSEEEPSFIEHINNELQYMSSKRFEQHREFWKDTFATVPEFISLNKNRSLTSLKAKRKSFALSQPLSMKLQSFCQEYNVSYFSVFYALLALYLAKISTKKDIVIGTPVLNRSGIREKNTAGMFMHNMPTRIYVEPDNNFASFVTGSFKELKKYLKNQRYPYSLILKDFREKHQFSGTLMDITLNYHNATYDDAMVPFEGTWNYSGAQTNSLSLSVSDRDATGIPVLDYDYLLEVFHEEDINQLHKSLCNLLTDAMDSPDKRIFELQMLSEDELKNLIYGFNQTKLAYRSQTLPEMFEEQARKSPDNTALVLGDLSLSYRELNAKANQLARYIRKKITPNTVIGLFVKRSPEMVIGILGILKAGGAYLPLDPSYPKERISYILSHSGTRLILTDHDDLKILIDPSYQFLNISQGNNVVYDSDLANLASFTSPADLAYILYTSGSSGKPKGVMVHHKALCNFINGIAAIFDLQGKTIIALTTISFDIFFLETILPLTLGMKVVIANEDEQTIPRLLFDLIAKHKVDILQATPSRMKLILNEGYGRECLKNLTYLLIGGEVFPTSLLSDIREVTQAKVYNMYGPTESTVWSTVKNLTWSERITIGKPIANTQIYILDDTLFPVPVEIAGEIFIAGDGVSLGYLNNPELSRKCFLPNPFVPGQIMYRTGDFGRWLSNGEIEYLGRNDNQVKIRGFRIELGEIEACLSGHPAVKEAVAVTRTDRIGKKHLCAYFTSEQRPEIKDLQAFILRYLPNYMLPASFTWLPHFPQTPNGKLDRLALPDPSEWVNNSTAKVYVAPRNDIEAKLAVLWAEALEVERVGIDDNLFALGGDSLTILEIMSGALAYTWKLNAQDFYEFPTIGELSSRITSFDQMDQETSTEIYLAKRKIVPNNRISPLNTGNLLLTGATGFLGIHILKQLLAQTDREIYCLVRGGEPQARLDEALEFYYGSFPALLRKRIKVIPGDITLKHFGLDDQAYQELARNVQTVIHSAGFTKHYGNYGDFEKVNVQGTCEVIDFCLNFGKSLNHISTISISGNYLVDQIRPDAVFREDDFYVGQDYKTNVYVRSKFAAENQVFKAEANGLSAAIFRVGILTGRHSDGKFQLNIEDNAFYRKIKALLLLQVIPESFLEQSIELTPVDLCAQGIVKIICVNQYDGLVFHMFNHRRLQTKDFLSFLNDLKLPIKIFSARKFNLSIVELSQTKHGKEILSGIITDLVIDKGLNFSNALSIDSSFTIDYLNQLGFTWPTIDERYIAKIIRYMQDVGFVEDMLNRTDIL